MITSRRAQSRRRLTAKGRGLDTDVYEKRFERRCDCCGDLEILPGLKYLSYNDPGRMVVDDSGSSFGHQGGCTSCPLFGSMDFVRENRSVYFPFAECARCRRGCGRAIWCITIAEARSSSAHYRGKEWVEDETAFLRSQLPHASPAWPINAPIWEGYGLSKRYFKYKFMGQAFFVCSCRSNPIIIEKHGHKIVHGNVHGGKAGFFLFPKTFDGDWTGCKGWFLHRHVCYRCPFLRGRPPLSDSDDDGEEDARMNVGMDISDAEESDARSLDARSPASQSEDEIEVGSDARDSDSDAH